MSSLYPYADGNRLADRNTYFYTRFDGVDFLDAWSECRERHSGAEPVPPRVPLPQVAPKDPDNVETAALEIEIGCCFRLGSVHLFLRFRYPY